jgi:hypothetical protein
MTSLHSMTRRLLQERRGVALPLALVGLILVSVVLTTAVVTSSSELAMGSAHRSATGALYTADASLQAYIAQNAGTALTLANRAEYTVPGTNQRVLISVERMHRTGEIFSAWAPDGNFPGLESRTRTRTEVFSVRAEPRQGTGAGGRPVMVMVNQDGMVREFRMPPVPPPPPVQTNIAARSAITMGGSLHVNGNAFWVSGRKTAADTCASGGGVQAVEHSRSAQVTTNNENHMQNFVGADGAVGRAAIIDSGMARDSLLYRTLGLEPGQTLDHLAAAVPDSMKWGPMFGRPNFSGTMKANHRVAVVDARGGTVDLNTGSGMIIILNGNVRLKGDTKWVGTIIVEGAFSLQGTPVVEGALISMGASRRYVGSTYNYVDLAGTELGNGGNVLVQYNACEMKKAQSAFNQVAQEHQGGNNQTPPAVPAPTSPFITTSNSMAWVELVR